MTEIMMKNAPQENLSAQVERVRALVGFDRASISRVDEEEKNDDVDQNKQLVDVLQRQDDLLAQLCNELDVCKDDVLKLRLVTVRLLFGKCKNVSLSSEPCVFNDCFCCVLSGIRIGFHLTSAAKN